MKNLNRILIISCLLCFPAYSFAQEIGIDGFNLGSSRMSAVMNVSNVKGKLKFDRRGDDWLRYATELHLPSLSYTLYFNNDKLVNVTKIEEKAIDPDMFEFFINEHYIDLVYEYGNPIMSGDKYAIWRGDNHKITFNYNMTCHEFPQVHFMPPTPPACKGIVIIICELINPNKSK